MEQCRILSGLCSRHGCVVPLLSSKRRIPPKNSAKAFTRCCKISYQAGMAPASCRAKMRMGSIRLPSSKCACPAHKSAARCGLAVLNKRGCVPISKRSRKSLTSFSSTPNRLLPLQQSAYADMVPSLVGQFHAIYFSPRRAGSSANVCHELWSGSSPKHIGAI